MNKFMEFLNENFRERTQKNPKYSLRAFARSLEIDHSTLSQLMRGKRKITNKTIRRISNKMGISPEQWLGAKRIINTEREIDVFHHEAI